METGSLLGSTGQRCLLALDGRLGEILCPQAVALVRSVLVFSQVLALFPPPTRPSKVCMTCQHFRYEVGRHCVTLLTCPIHQGLIPQGEHLTQRCSGWVPRREVAMGWCPEVA